MVPHLVTALTGPINELEQRILDSMPAIERWFRLEWMEHTPTFYCAADVRNAGFKLSAVDTDLFPGGWDNLTPSMLPLAVQAAMAAIEKICPEARNLLIVPENNANSTSYLNSLAQLRRIFHMAGLNVRVGSVSPDLTEPKTIALPGGESITLEPAVRTDGRLGLKDFDPCTLLLNNALRAGVPGILEDLSGQFLLPPLHAAAATRSKANHFKCYEEVAKRFGKLIGVDPWLMYPLSEKCTAVDTGSVAALESVRGGVDALLGKIKRRYKEYGIKEKPFVVIKTDNGRVSFDPISVRDTRELESLRMDSREPLDIILQEGVMTQERMNDSVAEPVVYMMDRYVVGGFYRVHAESGADEAFRTAGSSFVPLAFDESTHLPQLGVRPGASAPNRFYMYGVIGRLAMLAASYELEATDPQAEHYA
jgi:glutamate--cysteine ligase